MNMAKYTSFEDEFEIVPVTKEILDEAINVAVESYFVDESISKALKLSKSPEASKEIADVMVSVAIDGISFAVVEKTSGKVVGAWFNRLQVKTDEEKTFLEKSMEKCSHPIAKEWLKIFNDLDDLCEAVRCKCACIMEIYGAAVLAKYRRKGIATKMFEYCMSLAKSLASGDDAKTPLDSTPLPLTPVPQIITGIPTVAATQYLCSAFGFQTAFTIRFSSLSYEDLSFDRVIKEPDHIKYMYAAL